MYSLSQIADLEYHKPDIVKRLEKGIKLTPYNRDTFYLNGNIAEGYTDYPFAQ